MERISPIPQIAIKPPSIKEVDALADELVALFNNPKYRGWYCNVIYKLGVSRVRELLGRVKDYEYAGKLFTKLANDELRLLRVKELRSAS